MISLIIVYNIYIYTYLVYIFLHVSIEFVSVIILLGGGGRVLKQMAVPCARAEVCHPQASLPTLPRVMSGTSTVT